MKYICILIALSHILLSACQQKPKSSIPSSNADSLRPVEVATDLNRPWGITFPDAQTILVTERNGSLQYIKNSSKKAITLPLSVRAEGQGGLLDIKTSPDYTQSGFIYMTYSKKNNTSKSTTALVRFRLDDNQEVTDLEELFEALPYYEKPLHYGARIAFDEQGHVFVTLGDRYSYSSASEIPDLTKAFAQDLSKHWGKVIRLNLDGSVPSDNPFSNQTGALKEIYSYGHRNPQGIFYDKASSNLYINEHGAQGGDEINLIQAGKNYGWPVITYGIDYNGQSIGVGTSKEGMEQPLHYWDPSIAPSALVIYQGKRYSFWKNHALTTALRNQSLHSLALSGSGLKNEKVFFKQDFGRLRAIAISPDDFVYLLVDDEKGKVIRLSFP